MPTLTDYLACDHARCDELFVAAEEAAGHGDWEAAAALLSRFAEGLEKHFGAEESVLFPAFEAATGMTAGPTQIMRMEHAQMRQALQLLQAALALRDAAAYLGHSESLLILMQQHNTKEENILYPMADRSLGPRAAELICRMGLGGGEAS